MRKLIVISLICLSSVAITGCRSWGGYDPITQPVQAIGNAGDQLLQINGKIEQILFSAGGTGLNVNPALRACRKVDVGGLRLADILDRIDALASGDPTRPELIAEAIGILEGILVDLKLVKAPTGSTVELIQKIVAIVSEATHLITQTKTAIGGVK